MAKLPEFLLKALYMKGSLKSDGDGFQFQMKNELGPARIVGARPLQLDRKPLPMKQCRFIYNDQEAGFAEVTAEQSVLMRKGQAVTIKVEGIPLNRGRHTLGISFLVKDMGSIGFSVTDQVQ